MSDNVVDKVREALQVAYDLAHECEDLPGHTSVTARHICGEITAALAALERYDVVEGVQERRGPHYEVWPHAGKPWRTDKCILLVKKEAPHE